MRYAPPLGGGGAALCPPWGAAKSRRSAWGSLLCPIRPRRGLSGVAPAPLRPRHGQSAQRSADRATRLRRVAPASRWAARPHCS
jgi:hypothetical protein